MLHVTEGFQKGCISSERIPGCGALSGHQHTCDAAAGFLGVFFVLVLVFATLSVCSNGPEEPMRCS